MKRLSGRIAALIAAMIVLAACGSAEGKVETPAGMNMQRGRNYKESREDFEDKGFTNISTEPIEDLVYGRSFRYGEVETISVGGDRDYDPGVLVPKDTEVIIYYHAYSQKSIEEAAAAEAERQAAQEEIEKEKTEKADIQKEDAEKKESAKKKETEKDSGQEDNSEADSTEAPAEESGGAETDSQETSDEETDSEGTEGQEQNVE